ncbi:hypothetical protein FKX85_14645 [Echinicola soli]|uniref:Outer membrane protein beta-barrel domain-containing protein n=1 Tax=Echinicola soli TaxID=2591634 RepID=A0A514CK36_9BACT|nr:hypothetical protein [Echinicola soli]QDH80211.1 hypothetical protein FKX85_14645 [Echinicola soli]
MKKLFCVLAILCLFSLEGFSQDVRLNVYGSYVFADKFDSYWDVGNNYYYEGRIEDGFQWGGGIEYVVNDMIGVEVLYLRQDTNSPTRYSYSGFVDRRTNFDLGINYILVAPSRYFKAPSGNLEGFFGVMAGVVIADLYNPDNGNENNATKMAWGVKGGGIMWGSERVGLKVQAQLLSAVQSVGGGFYFGTGGAGAGVNSYSSIYQFSLGGGLVFKLN